MQYLSIKIKHRAWLLPAILLVLSGCGGGGSGAVTTSSAAQSVVSTSSPPPVLAAPATSATGSFTLSWTAPASRSDGSSLSLADIDGYRIYYGTTKGNYPNQINVTNGAATSKTVSNLAVRRYYLVMTTYDSSGRESARSPEISKTAL